MEDKYKEMPVSANSEAALQQPLVQGSAKAEKTEHAYSLSHTLLYSMLACVVLVVSIVALLLCRAQVRYSEQAILAGHRDKGQTYVESTVRWHCIHPAGFHPECAGTEEGRRRSQ